MSPRGSAAPCWSWGGNNATVIASSADLDLATNGTVFSAVGTAGQRCTTLRRLIVHNDVADALVERLVSAYRTLPIGDPFDDQILVGPLISAAAYDALQDALARAQRDGGKLLVGGTRRAHRTRDMSIRQSFR